jgi:hypothetical protein
MTISSNCATGTGGSVRTGSAARTGSGTTAGAGAACGITGEDAAGDGSTLRAGVVGVLLRVRAFTRDAAGSARRGTEGAGRGFGSASSTGAAGTGSVTLGWLTTASVSVTGAEAGADGTESAGAATCAAGAGALCRPATNDPAAAAERHPAASNPMPNGREIMYSS